MSITKLLLSLGMRLYLVKLKGTLSNQEFMAVRISVQKAIRTYYSIQAISPECSEEINVWKVWHTMQCSALQVHLQYFSISFDHGRQYGMILADLRIFFYVFQTKMSC